MHGIAEELTFRQAWTYAKDDTVLSHPLGAGGGGGECKAVGGHASCWNPVTAPIEVGSCPHTTHLALVHWEV
jgi:hypothetical protein